MAITQNPLLDDNTCYFTVLAVMDSLCLVIFVHKYTLSKANIGTRNILCTLILPQEYVFIQHLKSITQEQLVKPYCLM